MKTIEKKEATAALAEYVSNIAEEPVIITDKGKPIAALVAVNNADMETVSLSNNPEFLALIERSPVRHNAEGGISSEEMRRRLDLNQ
ncbi:MAG: hypothetical protein V3U73_08845 [bacterium]